MRWCLVVVCAVVAAAACSGGDDDDVGSRSSDPGVVATEVDDTAADVTSGGGSAEAPPVTTEPVEPDATVAVRVRAGSLDAELTGTVAESEDPFGVFMSCSGVRTAFVTYSVLASRPDGTARSASVTSVGVVDAPGVFEATIRVEPAVGAAIDAVGTMTIDDGFRTGSFMGFDAEGERVEGEFECDGPVDPVPVALDDADDDLDVVEVFALLRSGEAERLVGLVATTDVAIECPGLAGAPSPDGDLIVRAGPDDAIGAIDEFTLSGGAAPTMLLSAGSTTYEVRAVELGDDGSGAAGTFSGSAGDVTVDGAYRCS